MELAAEHQGYSSLLMWIVEYLLGLLHPDREHNSPVDLPSLKAMENVIDRFERRPG